MCDVVLASNSAVRASLLRSAGLTIMTERPRIDEAAIRHSLHAEGASARDIADALADAKARKISARNPGQLVLGCDQILVADNRVVSKSDDIAEAADLLKSLRGRSHELLSAACLYHDTVPVWRHVGTARLSMRTFSDAYLDRYLARNWLNVQSAVGCYHIEGEGVRLFSKIEGDLFVIMGLPLMELLDFLITRGDIDG